MGGPGRGDPDATRTLAPETPAPAPGEASSVEARTAATALLSNAGPVSPYPDHDDRDPATPPAAAALAEGDHVGRFSVLGKLGSGGMGVVYGAYDPELDRRVAIKVLGYTRERSREANLRLLREAQAMARLSHPNVVSVYDVGELDDRAVFLAMEFVDGVSLDRWLAAAPRTWREICDVLVQAGRGLAAAHRSGLIHRDFKPGNVLVDAEGRARVSDFGIARLGDGDDPEDDGPVATHGSGVTPLAIELTRTGTALGTPAYMAPEQHRGEAVDPRTDQFAFCVTAWEALYGQRPFVGTGPELLRTIAAGTVRVPTAGREVPPWLGPILRRGLASAPADRWPSLDALLARLADDPAVKRRQRIAVAAALVGVAGLAAGASYLAAGGKPDVCASAGRELAATWTPAIRSADEAAFRATGSPLAADHWRRVTGHIDGWTTAWIAARRDACEAHVRHAQSDDLYDRRVACLARGHSRLAALIDLLAKPDAALVRESVMAAATLPPPADCADVEALLGQRPLPADLAIRGEVATFRAEIERVNTLRVVGRYQDALALVTSLVDRAKSIDYAPLQAELGYGVGMLQSDNADAGAEASLRHAADLAAAARDNSLYAKVWGSLVFEVGFQRQRFDDAAVLRPIARQAVHLAGDDPDLAAGLDLDEGAVDYAHGDFPAAAVALERAVTVVEKRHGARSVNLVAPLNLLAAIKGSLHDAGAEAAYQRALDILGETVSPNHPRAGAILGNLGNLAFDQGRLEDATAYHRRALAIVEAALGHDSADLAPSLNGLAQPLWALGKWDEAFTLIDRARVLWEASLGPDHPYVAIALSNLGGLREEQGRCAEAMPYLERARAIQVKKLPPDSTTTAMTLLFLGGCLTDLGKPAEALPVIEEALKIDTAKGTALDQAGPKFEFGRALWATGKDRRRAVALAEEARAVLLADKGDQAQVAAGVKSGSGEVSAWLAGKTTAAPE